MKTESLTLIDHFFLCSHAVATTPQVSVAEVKPKGLIFVFVVD
jgi:hypothetical protein